MMIGETITTTTATPHRSNPTVQIPQWDPLDDPTSPVLSPFSNLNAHNANSSPFLDSLTALHRYLPSNDPDFSLSEELDLPVDAFSCDHFRMYEFKVRRCARGRSHDWTECPYAHPGEKARRRDPRKYHYAGSACPDFRKGACKKGDACEYAHGVFECWLHPARYRTQPCKDGPACRRRVCFFAHTPDQLRVLPHSPRESGSGSGDLHFVSSPTSVFISPPISPPSESPPMSPSSPSFDSVSELVTSMRGLQVGKMKVIPGMQFGSRFGSPRGSLLRPGFCSVPSTPSRIVTRPGPGQLDLWDVNLEEEPAMERVESGRNLRAKIYAKLSKENSLDRAEAVGPSPDFGWVSELVK